ncbi:MAG: lytic transglycosylase domain-containing protein [Deltaproteobacteria bacterium]|nr:lytic transglycosylase domain-containing protein [Deltaproteobacteria bacterium]
MRVHQSVTGIRVHRSQSKQNGIVKKGFAQHLEAAKKNKVVGGRGENPGRFFLGTLSPEHPTVSHLLIKHPDYGKECWKIIHSRINRNKPYTRISVGTKIFLDLRTKEITWRGDGTGTSSPVSHLSGGNPFPEGPSPKKMPPIHEKRVIDEAIDNAAVSHKLPRDLIAGVIQAESGFNADAVSIVGAKGLMQLMPETARELGIENPFDIQQNIDGGARYLKKMMDLFPDDLESALSAYNAGPGTALRYDGHVPYRETKEFVTRVMSFIR